MASDAWNTIKPQILTMLRSVPGIYGALGYRPAMLELAPFVVMSRIGIQRLFSEDVLSETYRARMRLFALLGDEQGADEELDALIVAVLNVFDADPTLSGTCSIALALEVEYDPEGNIDKFGDTDYLYVDIYLDAQVLSEPPFPV